jgi:hypothetical protein
VSQQILKIDNKKLSETLPGLKGSYKDAYDACYKLLFENYRCEYIYKK